MESVDTNQGKLLFVEGYGGTGKTYLWKAITTKIRGEGKIVLVVASCGITALLLEGGMTTHSRFHIPLNTTEESTCGIKQGADLTALLNRTSLIIWDEAPMAHRNCFEVLDKSLRDILRCTNENSERMPFGGMTVVLGGDFRQILPVVTKGRREHIVNASIKHSYLWKHFIVYKLKRNMRSSCISDDIDEKKRLQDFAEWILNIGDGNTTSDDGDELIQILDDILLEKGVDPRETIINSTYPDLLSNYRERMFPEERAILCPRNDTVQEINDYIMDKLSGEEMVYRSCDSVCTASTDGSDQLYPTEFLNTLKFSGMLDHELRLEVGLPVMYNGTRMTITQHGNKYIEAQIITETHMGDKVCIPWIIMTPNDKKWPFKLKRRQFPLSVYLL
jgi:hypothetical protein